jgi:hypothetical protein
LVGCVILATAAAQAASPGWKLIGATGPTNLPPKQSETQRVTVEAEGGTFLLMQKAAEGEGTVTQALGVGPITEGSNIAQINFALTPTFAVGQAVTGTGMAPGTTIIGISGPALSPTLELSQPATKSELFAFLTGTPNEITGVTTSSGQFNVGDVISGEKLLPGTRITAVGSGTLTVSKFPTGGGTFALTGSQATAPLAFDAPASAVQAALEAVPVIGAGGVTVSGGPGGEEGAHPYFVGFAGALADQPVDELGADGAELTGDNANVKVLTTVPGGPGTGEIVVIATNVGAAPTVGDVTMELGPLPAGVVTSGPVKGLGWECPTASGLSTVVCTSHEAVPAFNPAIGISVPVEVEPTVASTSAVQVMISGGGAGPATYEIPIVISPQQARPGPAAFWAGAFDENGETELRAGAHPISAATYFLLNTVRATSGKIVPAGQSKNVIVDLPPGFVGNPLVTERCPQSQPAGGVGTSLCGQEAILGNFQPIISHLNESGGNRYSIYNTVPAKGVAAEFSTRIVTPIQSLLGSIRAEDDFGVRITAPNNPNYGLLFGGFASLEGVPAAANGKAFLSNPTDCFEEARRTPVVKTATATWDEPDVYARTTYALPPVIGCENLEFEPSFSFQPTTTTGSSGTGATAVLRVPQDGLTDPSKLNTPALRKAVVTLPEGLTLNPSSAAGLQSCSEAQIGYVGPGPMPNPTRFNEASPSCPDGSKLGTVEVNSPLLEDPLAGTVYLGAQNENPFGSLIALYLVVDDAKTGIVLKLPGEVKPDPKTGQLTAIFDNNPQLPFEDLTLHFRGDGPRSELATPEVCGSYATTGSLTPWSAPESGPPAQIEEAGFNVSSGCSASAGARPFAPSFEAGTVGTKAGAHTPLVVNVTRKDGEQELSSLDFTLPEGLTGKLAGTPYCPEGAIKAAESINGRSEQANASCPAASQLGSVDTAAGVGSEPFHVGGKVYLAGPYKGAPISSVVVTPAVAGPFDLGNVVVRAPLYVNPETAQLTAKSDPIPTILQGIPLKVRSISIHVDRPGFILNPTSCEPMKASASIAGGSGATATTTARFQVGGCKELKFSPKLKIALKGGTRRNGHPALVAKLTQPAGQANIGKVSVALPHSEFLDQDHIRTICTRVQFAADECPEGAIYGQAEAISPLLDSPLRGPVYLRSSNHTLPDLVVALRGPDSQPIEVELAGRIDSVNGGIRNSFELVPDAPVSKFVLRMQGGKKGLVVNSTNICRGSHKATVKMEGQNGKLRNFSTPLQARCGGKKPKPKTKK